MRELKRFEETVVKEETLSLTCDCCGKTVDGEMEVLSSDINDFHINFGYGSKFDMDTWNFDVCDECLEKWVSTFKHPIDKVERH